MTTEPAPAKNASNRVATSNFISANFLSPGREIQCGALPSATGARSGLQRDPISNHGWREGRSSEAAANWNVHGVARKADEIETPTILVSLTHTGLLEFETSTSKLAAPGGGSKCGGRAIPTRHPERSCAVGEGGRRNAVEGPLTFRGRRRREGAMTNEEWRMTKESRMMKLQSLTANPRPFTTNRHLRPHRELEVLRLRSAKPPLRSG